MTRPSTRLTKFIFESLFFGFGFLIALGVLLGVVQYLRLKNEYMTFSAIVQKPAFSISSPAMMIVNELQVDTGAPVKQGQPLAVLQALEGTSVSGFTSDSGVFRAGEKERQVIITSPTDGVISQVTIFAGSTVKPAQDMFFVAAYKDSNIFIRFDFAHLQFGEFSNWQLVDQVTGKRFPIEVEGTKKAKNTYGEVSLAARFRTASDSVQFVDQEQVSVTALKKSSVPDWFKLPKLTRTR